MRSNSMKSTLKATLLAVTILLLTAGLASAQTVSLTASQQTTTLPDGNTVPMWGWTCGAITQGTTGTTTCTAPTYNTTTGVLNPQTGGTIWQPPLIVVPYVTTGASLTINLTNSLPVETSITILGQVAGASATNGGLGTPVREPAGPRTDGDHAGQTFTTWTTVSPGSFTPPTQEARVRSFVAEVAGVTTVGATPAVGAYTWTNLQPGTYLIRTGTYPSIQGPMGLYGVLVVTQAPVAGTSPGLAYPVPAGQAVTGVTYDADVVALESEMDPRQNKMVAADFQSAVSPATANAGFLETTKWNAQCGAATNSLLTSTGAIPTCYPPAVDYTPTYFMINGVAFSKDNQPASALSIPAVGATGNVLVRYVNAGSHMHVPTVNGLNMLLVAEDGYVLPDVALALSQSPAKTLSANTTALPAGAAVGLQVRNEVFQAAGKVYDVIVSPKQTVAGTYDSATYPTWDRALALGTNAMATNGGGGMQAILDVNDLLTCTTATPPVCNNKLTAANSKVTANPDTYAYAPGVTLSVTSPGKGVIANDVNVYGVQVSTPPGAGAVTLLPNGTFTYVPTGSSADSFGYCANGTTLTSIPSMCTTVTLNASATANAANAPVANPDSYTSPLASFVRAAAPGVLGNDYDPNGFPLTAVFTGSTGLTVNLASDGSFSAVPTVVGGCAPPTGCSFAYQAKNSQGILSNSATATLIFQAGSGLVVNVYDAPSYTAGTLVPITDYKWIIEQDLTPQINPLCQLNGAGRPLPPICPVGLSATPATQFHTSYMPVIAEGCTGPQSCEKGQTVYDAGTPCTGTLVPPACSLTAGQHVLAACDGYGTCTVGASQLPATSPADAHLTASNPDGTPAVYYISILSGDSQNAFSYANVKDPTIPGNCTPGSAAPGQTPNSTTEPTGITESSACGHTMGGAPIPAATSCTGTPGAYTACTYATPVLVKLEPEPLRTATVTGFIFEDDYPLNGEPDTGGGVDALATLETSLGDFQIEIWDTAGGIGDNTGQMTYDMFNVPLSNALNGTIDENTHLDACPISNTASGVGIGTIVVCPEFEGDGMTRSPLTGQFVVKNLMQGKFTLIAHPGAVREANGEEWLQTNSLDGGHFLDSFLKVGEPPYFTEFGPGGYHVFFGMANPKIINARLASICAGAPIAEVPFTAPCNNTINGQVTSLHQSRSPQEQLFSSAVYPTNSGGNNGDARNYGMLNYTNCYAALGDSDGATIALAKCDPGGNFTFSNVPSGNYGVVVFDQWNDLIVDGSSHALNIPVNTSTTANQQINVVYPSFTWQAHLWNRTYMDIGGLGRPVLASDGSGNLDPVLSPGLIQTPIRIRQTNGKFVNTLFTDISGVAHFDETFPLFAFYNVESDSTRFRSTGVHAVNDSGGQVDGPTAGGGNGRTTGAYPGILNSTPSFELPVPLQYPGSIYCGLADCTDITATNRVGPNTSTGRIDPTSVEVEGWQGGVSEYDILEWGKTPYLAGENGGIRGHVANGTTRPFDDPHMTFQNLWMPLVPNVTVNLYQEGTAPDGTPSLTLVDTTKTTSWDSWAQGFRADGVTPNMSCTGQDPVNDPFFGYTLAGTRNYLSPLTPLPNNSQYKCYDGYHNLNQLQPAPYDGLYEFPSATCMTPGATFSLPGNAKTYTCATIPNPYFGQSGATGAGAKPAVLQSNNKFVVEMVVPPNWELSKEEDLNLLIGDQYIAPVTAQFGNSGLGSIFIVPDQATIDFNNPSYTGPYTSLNNYTQPFNCPTPTTCTVAPNMKNNGKPSTDIGREDYGSFGPGGIILQSAPCVGRMRVVPDYLSISPESGEVAPFAGATRPLCDRKEVTLNDQMQADADFFIFTQTPKTTSFTGFISDDFSSEFDPASPSFGEKFAVPNVPIAIRDFNGVEISRIYADQFGTYNGLVYSTWEVDPPNITGYSPNVMVTCMNDPGPIPGPGGTMITDPYYNPAYSAFCYENPFMPADTQYLDTPVVPTSAFAEGYNPPDCAYPDATPMIKSVTGDTSGGGAGPWVSRAGHTLTVTALGDTSVPNNAYSGPAASTAPFNKKFITRHYGFGTGPTVTIGGRPTECTGGDLTMTCTVPRGVPDCAIQQEVVPTGTTRAQCGELIITAANGKQSIDTVTVTIGGKAPAYVAGENSTSNAIQTAIDSATSGDLIIVGPGTYTEMLLMWKPVRLQGVGDGSVTVNASTFPAGKLLQPWRAKVNCLFGLALNGGYSTGNNTGGPAGGPYTGGGSNPYDPTFNGNQATAGTQGNGFYCAQVTSSTAVPPVDPVPGEPIIGWDATLNGNIAELLQEPTLLGAYEGAAITLLAKGLENNNTTNCNPEGATGCIELNPCQLYAITDATTLAVTCTNSPLAPSVLGDCNVATPFYATNYLCNPSRVDGLTFTDSSQGGGGVWLHGWNHYTEVSNLHVFGNGGTLTGGIVVGQPENIDPTLVGTIAQPLLQTTHTYVHNNSITFNTAYGDELNSNTPASAGGVSFCTGTDYYKFQHNWVCGNFSTGNGGGFAHYGFIYSGDIEHNSFLFNQSINPSLVTYGGGAIVGGQAPDGAACENAAIDFDCPPALSDGAGPGLIINANLFQGNTAEEGSGGGLRLQFMNGNDVLNNPSNPDNWYTAQVTNNIFVNNVAGWTGGGVSLIDSLRVNFVNNTVVSNDNTSSAGVLFDSLGAPGADVPPPGCDPSNPLTPNCEGSQITTSTPQPAGLSVEPNTANLIAAFTTPVTCPIGNSGCTKFSNPMLNNNLFWQNRAFNITVTPTTGGVVALVPSLSQTVTGQCPTGANYWDIGVYGDSGPSNHASGLTLSPVYSVLTDATDYPGANNLGSNPNVVGQYCNGSRVPAEIAPTLCAGPSGFANAQGCTPPGAVGITVPPGVPDSVVPPLPLFTLTPAATIDEGSNWINMFYGPLSQTNPTIQTGGANFGVLLGNYALATGSPAIDFIPSTSPTYALAPSTDFFGNPRPDGATGSAIDIGAVEFVVAVGGGGGTAVVGFSAPSPALTTGTLNRTTKNGTITVTNSGTGGLTLSANPTITKTAGPGTFSIQPGGTCVSGAIVASGNGQCTINVRYTPPGSPATLMTATAHVTLADIGAITASQNSPNFNGN
jgi:hypothetical protein